MRAYRAQAMAMSLPLQPAVDPVAQGVEPGLAVVWGAEKPDAVDLELVERSGVWQSYAALLKPPADANAADLRISS